VSSGRFRVRAELFPSILPVRFPNVQDTRLAGTPRSRAAVQDRDRLPALARVAMNHPIIIRPYRDDDSVPSITRLLHDAYAPLAALGLRYTATHQDDATTLRRLTRGIPFVGEIEGEIVATVTLYPTESAPGACCRWYAEPGVFSFGQFAVRPDLQKQGLGARMIGLLENEALSRGAHELALDTAEPAVHLRSWYDKLGFRFIEFADGSTTNYRSVILSKSLVPSAGR